MQLVSKITPATFDFDNQLGNSWVQYFLSRVFREFNIFFVGILWVQNIFLVVGCMGKTDRKQKFINASQTVYSIPD